MFFSCFSLLTFHGFNPQQNGPVAELPDLAQRLAYCVCIFWGIYNQVQLLNGYRNHVLRDMKSMLKITFQSSLL